MEVIAVFCQDKVVKPFQSFFDFPHNVRSIILVEFMERYAYYAFRAILTIYFISELKLKVCSATFSPSLLEAAACPQFLTSSLCLSLFDSPRFSLPRCSL